MLHIVDDLYRRTTSDDFVFIFQVRFVGSGAQELPLHNPEHQPRGGSGAPWLMVNMPARCTACAVRAAWQTAAVLDV